MTESAPNFQPFDFKPLLEDRFALGEGPHWDAEHGELLWVDIVGRKAFAHVPASGETRHWSFDDTVSAIAPRGNGHYVVAAGRGVYDLDPQDGRLTVIAEPAEEPAENRTNESRVDPRGRFWMASMQQNIGPNGEHIPVRQSSGLLWCIDTDGSVRQVASGIGISNSLVWSPDETRMYFADTLKGVIWQYDWDADTGAASNRRVFADTEGYGNPDGSAMDEEGCLWSARWGAGCLIRYRPDGEIDRIVEVPARCPSSCVFGGPDRKTLYVTTAYAELDPSERGPCDGALLVAETDVVGQRCFTFNG
ncbi:SMP-30/gluconolactonase/LRE family protein [Marinobacter sp. JSM 1782161]|uniref:SMP-30/gluconolactonase/LRE family protein n=1 Tax=Marinobacter sp. JSM 1782161 TaxID=2685906 RepID=UPI0014021443|nr:SMP-30/gluconolactonase/LRE family protein [Marinobacter sp. JSM 1782161]